MLELYNLKPLQLSNLATRVSSRGPDPRMIPDPRMFWDPRSPTPLSPGPRRGWKILEFLLQINEFQRIS